MVAFIDLPKVAWVRTTAVTTVHSGSGTLSKCEKAKPDSAAIVTLRDRPSCALCSGNCDRSDLHSVATLLIRNSVRQCPTRTDLGPSAFCRFHATVQNTFNVERRLPYADEALRSRANAAGSDCCDGVEARRRKACSSGTTAAPSPMAPPTRLTEPERTSPTAKTPVTLDWCFVPSRTSLPDRPGEGPASKPVFTKPFLSRVIPQSRSQSVAGSAPMKRNRLRIARSVSSPVFRFFQRTRSSRPS